MLKKDSPCEFFRMSNWCASSSPRQICKKDVTVPAKKLPNLKAKATNQRQKQDTLWCSTQRQFNFEMDNKTRSFNNSEITCVTPWRSILKRLIIQLPVASASVNAFVMRSWKNILLTEWMMQANCRCKPVVVSQHFQMHRWKASQKTLNLRWYLLWSSSWSILFQFQYVDQFL